MLNFFCQMTVFCFDSCVSVSVKENWEQTENKLGYLRAPERFGDRIISRHTRIPWPACSPDLNPLDYSFWGQCERQIALKKPKGRDEIIRVVNEYAASLSEELIRSMTNNIIKRARLCVDQNGGHFEHLLNKNEE